MPSGTAADSAATASLSEALAGFFRATRRARGRAASQTPAGGISLAQFHLLEPLAEGPRTNRQLAEAAGITSPTATRMIDGLVGRGLVTRVEDPADRRAVLISLTDTGSDALAAKVEEYSRVRVQLAETLEPEERLAAADLLNRLAVVIEEL
jgi:DNA-binding MarR family transcriptional regulator